MLEISVSVVPTHGEAVNKKIKVAPSGASVAEICKAAGIDTENKDLTVNGKPADLQTHVTQDDVLQAKERGQSVVTTSERPRGS